MKTLIELYDTNVVFNISAAVAMKPENIFFICGEAVSNKRKTLIKEMLLKHAPRSVVKFFDVVLSDEEKTQETFERILNMGSDCAVELSGGSELLSFYAGRYLKDINAFIYRPKSGKITYVSGPLKGKTERCRISLDIDDFAFMAGGRYVSHGHFDINSFDEDVYKDAKKVWKVFLRYKDEWHKFVNFFQLISSEASLKYNGPARLKKKDGNYISVNINILEALCRDGIIKNLGISGNIISFQFKNRTMKELMSDFGIWLEIHIYRSVVDSGKFDSAQMSVILDWNERANETDDVINEIDVVVTKGITPLFISCKAGMVTTAALNEISVLSKRFGSGVAKAVLVTTTDLSEVSAKTYKRASEMGIHVIDLSDLTEEEPADILERIINNG